MGWVIFNQMIEDKEDWHAVVHGVGGGGQWGKGLNRTQRKNTLTFGEAVEVFRNLITAFWPFIVTFITVIALVSVSFRC